MKTNSQKLTIKQYNLRDKKGDESEDHYVGEEITVEEWMQLLKKGVDWPLVNDCGIRNEDKDRALELHVDWFYAPAGVSPAGNPTVTLEQYYTTGEGVNIETSETPSVDDSRDLSYPHDKGSSKLYGAPKVLAQLNAGDPWVSYSVEKDKNGAYKLKDGTTAPVSKTGDASKIDVTAKKNGKNAGNSFANTKPDCGFTKDDLKEKKDVNSKRTVSEIPYVLKNSVKSTGYNSTNNTVVVKHFCNT